VGNTGCGCDSLKLAGVGGEDARAERREVEGQEGEEDGE
jgi:hypothetical protein